MYPHTGEAFGNFAEHALGATYDGFDFLGGGCGWLDDYLIVAVYLGGGPDVVGGHACHVVVAEAIEQ